MKKLFALFVCLILVISLSACYQQNDSNGIITIIIAGEKNEEYFVDISKVEVKQGVLSVLNYLKETESLSFSTSGSGEFTFIEKIGGLQPDKSKGEYVYAYTNIESDFDVSGYARTITYNGQALTSAGVGIVSMSVIDGAIIYFGVIKY